MHKFKNFIKKAWSTLRPQLCKDCQEKLGKKYRLPFTHKVKHAAKRAASKAKRKLSPGIHMVKVKGQGLRKVKVLANGRWVFMKK